MTGRGGLPLKNIIYVVFALFFVYMMYIYHGSQNRLHEAEMTGARYKREADERVSEIQDMVKNHDKFQESCRKEKRELQNTINSVNTKYQMLESHQKDLEADLNTMKQHMETMKQEHSDAYTQHAQEFQTLKQDKDNEIAKIKDELANARRRNVDLENRINKLKDQIQTEESIAEKYKSKLQNMDRDMLLLQSGRNQLMQENQRLQQSLNAKQQLPQGGLQQQQQHDGGLVLQQQQQQHQQQQEGGLADDNRKQGALKVEGNKFDQRPDDINHLSEKKMDDSAIDMKIKNNPIGIDTFAQDSMGKAVNAEHQDDGLDQVRPPKVNSDGEDADLQEREEDGPGDRHGDEQEAVNPNDEQKGQILEPLIPKNSDNKDGHKNNDDDNNNDDHKDNNNNYEEDRDDDGVRGGGEEGEDTRNAREEEDDREAKVLREEQEENARPQNPLALRQIEMPGDLGQGHQEVKEDEEELRDRGGPGVGAGIGQQLPPILDREMEQEKFGDKRSARRSINPEAPN